MAHLRSHARAYGTAYMHGAPIVACVAMAEAPRPIAGEVVHDLSSRRHAKPALGTEGLCAMCSIVLASLPPAVKRY